MPAGNVANGMPMQPGMGINQARPPSHAMQGIPAAPVNGTAISANGRAMKMIPPQPGMQQAAANGARMGIPLQALPENARVMLEANRLQEQQRLLQSRQQQQQFTAQNPSNMNISTTATNGAMMAAFHPGMQNPVFHNGTGQTPSPRMGQPNPLSGGVVPTITNFEIQIQRNNPGLPPEQVNKLATERLQQYQQQRMTQAAMNAAAAAAAAAGGGGGNYQTFPQPGVQPNNGGGNAGMSMRGNFSSPVMRTQQLQQGGRVSVGNSPQMNGVVPPQMQRSGSGGAGPARSPRPPQAQMAGS